MAKKDKSDTHISPREWDSTQEIDWAIKKLQRRIDELEQLDVRAAVLKDSGADDVVQSNIRETILEVFGTNSPEFEEHEHLRIWAGPMRMGMSRAEVIEAKQRGVIQTRGILEGLIGRLEEKKEDLETDFSAKPRDYLHQLNLHPRIATVATELFIDGHHWEAVFAGAKALVNYVKEKSGRHDLDGTHLMRTVFSRNDPILAFNDLTDRTDEDEQEGMMHLYEGVALAVRNPGGHDFPEGPEQRAIEYLSLLSLLAYRVEESQKIKKHKA